MQSHSLRLAALAAATTIAWLTTLGGPALPLAAQATRKAAAPVSWQVFARGLDNPRGLHFGPDGALYVAEGGRGGTKLTTKQDCEQVPEPSGPYRGGMTARISRIDANGKRTTVIDGLPSTQTAPQSGSSVSGVADVAFLSDTLYALIAGAGCSHGNKGTVNALLRITASGQAVQVADLSNFLMANPVKNIDPDDFEPDGDFYSMVAVEGKFYVVEANHGVLEEVTPDGKITRISDISASQGHVVPTSVAYHDGNFYVGSLSVFPVHTGSARAYKITRKGEVTVLAPPLSAVLGMAFDQQGQMYALETSTKDNAFPTPRFGDVVRISPDSTEVEVIATGLTFPTAMTFGPDGLLYVSNYGFGYGPGRGEIVRMAVPPAR
jgi:glucose/arabinose dehydrogenase